jgi:hypothetical protein
MIVSDVPAMHSTLSFAERLGNNVSRRRDVNEEKVWK